MNIEQGQTMAFGYGRRSSHRSLRVNKVENGYEVHAAFQVEGFKAPHPNMEAHPIVVDKTYVFYTEAEVANFVMEYLSAPQDEIRK